MNIEEKSKQQFKEKGYCIVKNTLSKEICRFLSHSLLRQHHDNVISNNPSGDSQVLNALSVSSDIYTDTVLEMLWPLAEKVVGDLLIPTYSYSRLYCNGSVLEPHTDRESCEVSMTIQLSRSHDYSWPIYVDDNVNYLDEGDAAVYLGCDKKHWRKECSGPANYYSGQIFIHFVKANGHFKHFAGDGRWRYDIPFTRNRVSWYDNK